MDQHNPPVPVVRCPAASPTVTVAVLTYRRPASLRTTLDSLRHPVDPPGASPWQFHEVLVIDNDIAPSARYTVDELVEGGYPHPVRYVHEGSPGLAAARNRALDEASGSILAFIDDDEVAEDGWPGGLVTVLVETAAALVGGPVRTRFAHEPPGWVRAGGYFDRYEPPDRTRQSWLRSGNLAIDLRAIEAAGIRFDHRFGLTGGEDVAFSRAARRAGLDLRWSASAPVTETVGPERTTLRWLLARERAAISSWVRVDRQLDGSRRRALLHVARAASRGLQGAVIALAGLATLDSSRRNKGLVLGSRGLGIALGLAARAEGTYRKSNVASSR